MAGQGKKHDQGKAAEEGQLVFDILGNQIQLVEVLIVGSLDRQLYRQSLLFIEVARSTSQQLPKIQV